MNDVKMTSQETQHHKSYDKHMINTNAQGDSQVIHSIVDWLECC